MNGTYESFLTKDRRWRLLCVKYIPALNRFTMLNLFSISIADFLHRKIIGTQKCCVSQDTSFCSLNNYDFHLGIIGSSLDTIAQYNQSSGEIRIFLFRLSIRK